MFVDLISLLCAGKPQNGASSQEHAQSDIKISGPDNIKLSRRISSNKPIPNSKSVGNLVYKMMLISRNKAILPFLCLVQLYMHFYFGSAIKL